nr:MAG TPA: helix-turn-helix domain protein [Caudoviricetes sp.]
MNMGARIKKARKNAGMTQADLAGCLAITREHLVYIENGQKSPSIALLRNIAKATGVKATDLLGDD